MKREQFEIYVNHIHRYAMGHRIGCSQAKKHGGARTATGGHMEPFDSAEENELAGRMTGLRFDWCFYCCEDLRRLCTSLRSAACLNRIEV